MSSLRGRGTGPGPLLMVVVALLLLVNPSCEVPGDDGPGRRGSREAAPLSPGSRVAAFVIDVTDGDTIEVRLLEDAGKAEGRIEDVRYIGIDTPETVAEGEPVQCFGPQASDFNKHLVAGRQVTLVFDAEVRDRYDRLLAYVYLGPALVNAALVRRGLARTLEIEPNDSKARLFERLEGSAARSGRGLWHACQA